jgi:hypothetical protein
MEVMKRSKSSLLLIPLLLLCTALVANGCGQERRPNRYLIPEGYVGWVKVYFNVKDAPELSIEDGRYLLKFPLSGILKTSSDIEFGWAEDEYFYYAGDERHSLKITGWGEGGMVWGGYNSSSLNVVDGNFSTEALGGKKDVYAGMFVGTEAEYKAHSAKQNEVGNIKERATEHKR